MGRRGANMEHLTRGKIAEMKVQFRNMDQNQNGYLSFNELETICSLVGIIDNTSIKEIIGKFDEAGDGRLTFDDFVRMVNQQEEEPTSPREEIDTIKEAFHNFDKNGDGFMNKEELSCLLQRMGSEVSEEQLEKLFSEADINGDGRIDFEEFVKVLKKDS